MLLSIISIGKVAGTLTQTTSNSPLSDRFWTAVDFFTIDVADFIGTPVDDSDITKFVDTHGELIGELKLARYANELRSRSRVRDACYSRQYLGACKAAGEIYRHIANSKGEDNFIAEVSMDETDSPQTPPELMVILAALSDQKIRLQTIAPKFTGRFNKGVDYVGDVDQFRREFNEDLAVIAEAIVRYGLPSNLKLSVHSGSDKFSIYPAIREAIQSQRCRRSLEDCRDDLAGGIDRPCRSRWRWTGTHQRDLRVFA